MRISDWSSDVCSSDVCNACALHHDHSQRAENNCMGGELPAREVARDLHLPVLGIPTSLVARHRQKSQRSSQDIRAWDKFSGKYLPHKSRFRTGNRSEEHTSELQSLMRIWYAVF